MQTEENRTVSSISGVRRLGWPAIILFLPARMVLILLSQAVAAGVLGLAGDPTPWESSQRWWMVYGTLADLGCLGLLVLLTRREGLRLRDLFGVTRQNLPRQFRAIPLYLLASIPFVAGSAAIAIPFTGLQSIPLQVTVVDLPAGAAWYSVIVWPVIWAITEELVYLGFLLPRLEALTGRTWVAALVVVGMWSAQHLVIPFIADPVYLVTRFLSALVVVTGMTLVYLLLRRRLLATIVVHWIADTSTAVLAALILAH